MKSTPCYCRIRLPKPREKDVLTAKSQPEYADMQPMRAESYVGKDSALLLYALCLCRLEIRRYNANHTMQ